MKHLIVKGEAGSGKTLLAELIRSVTGENRNVLDAEIIECTDTYSILQQVKYPDIFYIFTTNSNINYGEEITKEKFLIIELKKFI